jgi:hypothetical protein
MASTTKIDEIQFLPMRRRLRRRILLFSFLFASIVLILGLGMFSVIEVFLPAKMLEERNRETFARIDCGLQDCDISGIANDFEFNGSEFVLDKNTNFVLNLSWDESFPDARLLFSDTAFAGKYSTPADCKTPSQEMWRLYSEEKQLGERRLVVAVGYASHASWKMDLPSGKPYVVDKALKGQAARIMEALRSEDGRIKLPDAARKRIVVDGYQIVDIATDRLIAGGQQIPVYFPRGKPLPSEGTSLQRDKGRIHLIRTDTRGQLLAVTSYEIGDMSILAALFASLFVISATAAYGSGISFLRKYFILGQMRAHSVDEALRLGEGLSIEFKRSLLFDNSTSVEQVLQTLVAFANTNGGIILIGVDDEARVKGITLEGPKQRDVFSSRIYNIVRQRVRPTPFIQIEYAEVRGFNVCRILVPRGDAPLHFLDGVIYVRYGASDIKAQPEIVKRILTQWTL